MLARYRKETTGGLAELPPCFAGGSTRPSSQVRRATGPSRHIRAPSPIAGLPSAWLRYPSRVAHYLFNFDGGRDEAVDLLDAKMWGIGDDEVVRDALVAGDLALIFVATPQGEFVGRARLATEVHEWTRREADAYPGDSPGGVLLSDVEHWEHGLPMETVVTRIDPMATNPVVQTNATLGFQRGVVRITANEDESALALSRERRRS